MSRSPGLPGPHAYSLENSDTLPSPWPLLSSLSLCLPFLKSTLLLNASTPPELPSTLPELPCWEPRRNAALLMGQGWAPGWGGAYGPKSIGPAATQEAETEKSPLALFICLTHHISLKVDHEEKKGWLSER